MRLRRIGARCPLDGAWANVWTTAADASFSPNSTRGDASGGGERLGARLRAGRGMDEEQRAGEAHRPVPLHLCCCCFAVAAILLLSAMLLFKFAGSRLSRLRVDEMLRQR